MPTQSFLFPMTCVHVLFVFALARSVAADVGSLSDANIEDTQALLSDWGLHKQFGREVCSLWDVRLNLFCLLVCCWLVCYLGFVLV